ncbi:PREDICTED: probable salivary secreted peptide [Vollenhovia emeryi]|uniref:probable salivary secreted peptide n=1 Tax=Vollenhovia emeryi TaxID=411798 RepID=UPI0005F3B5F0|nr:PREDICTED: probable salivary secreted peptide [Vollenhovia emeryi]
MSAYKYVIGLAVLVTALLTISTVPASGSITSYAAANKSHHLRVGYRMPGDRLVLRESVIKNSAWMKVQIVEKTFNVSKWERITMVEALDQKTNGNGAHANIQKGGPGYSNVTLKFKSQRGHGINFVVQVYSRP